MFSLPYGYGIMEPVYCAYDGQNNRARMAYYDGMDSYLFRFDTNQTYMVIPRVDKLVCFGSPTDPTQPQDLPTVLPDISDWTWMGDTANHRIWQKNVTTLEHTSVYTMEVTLSGRPLRLTMLGYDFLFGSHPDEYIFDYLSYQPSVRVEDFTVPDLCNQASINERAGARADAMTSVLRHLVSPTQTSQNKFDDYLATHKKSYSTPELHTRYQKWKKNAKLVEEHNLKADQSYSLKLNHFADWDHDEFKFLILPKSLHSGPKPTFHATYVHPEPTAAEIAALPTSVDWREKNAVTMVKDQGVCGSCWTFGTTGSVEGTYAVKYGKLISVSEQQIVDCAWTLDIGQGDSGCDGGFAGPAMQWIMDNNGIALETDYRYLMVDGWCDSSIKSSGITLKGYVNVTMNSEAALQQAVATVGPVAVAIDAAHEHFEFYGNGVYYNANCKSDMDSLDHEVLVVGYGTEDGADYWIVKNSWSTNWGNDGYIKMARNRNNNCGIATQATYPLV